MAASPSTCPARIRLSVPLHFKEDSNEQLCGSERWQWLCTVPYYSGTMAIDGYLHLNRQFLCKNLFPFPLASALLIGDVVMNFTTFICFVYSKIWKFIKTIRPKSICVNNTSAPIYWRNHSLFLEQASTLKLHITIDRHKYQTKAQLLSPSRHPSFLVTIHV